MNSHELAKELLEGENLPISASIDISEDGDGTDGTRRIFTNECFGVNNLNGDGGEIVILFGADAQDNEGRKFHMEAPLEIEEEL